MATSGGVPGGAEGGGEAAANTREVRARARLGGFGAAGATECLPEGRLPVQPARPLAPAAPSLGGLRGARHGAQRRVCGQGSGCTLPPPPAALAAPAARRPPATAPRARRQAAGGGRAPPASRPCRARGCPPARAVCARPDVPCCCCVRVRVRVCALARRSWPQTQSRRCGGSSTLPASERAPCTPSSLRSVYVCVSCIVSVNVLPHQCDQCAQVHLPVSPTGQCVTRSPLPTPPLLRSALPGVHSAPAPLPRPRAHEPGARHGRGRGLARAWVCGRGVWACVD